MPSGLTTVVPFRGAVPSDAVTVSPSTSDRATAPLTATSSSVVWLSSAATGLSFTGSTVIVTVAVSVPPLPSEAEMVNVSVPLKSAFGV